MKLSVSIPEEDVAALDKHIRKVGLRSRSAAIQRAIRLLEQTGLEEDYAAAWKEWDDSGDRAVWEKAAKDGLS